MYKSCMLKITKPMKENFKTLRKKREVHCVYGLEYLR